MGRLSTTECTYLPTFPGCVWLICRWCAMVTYFVWALLFFWILVRALFFLPCLRLCR